MDFHAPLRTQALNKLNYRKPQHPPDIYFIRRNADFLSKYMDPKEMNQLKKEAQPRFKVNYDLFSLDPDEKKIIHDMKNRKRSFVNPNDPFYTKHYGAFKRQYDGIYQTEKVLGIISPRDHKNLMNQTTDQIKLRSKELMHSFCDRDNVYNPRAGQQDQQNAKASMTPVAADSDLIKPLRKHDRVRQLKDEGVRIQRIENDLFGSKELRQVSKPQDTDEFEDLTNQEFNRNFEQDLMSSHEYHDTGFQLQHATVKQPRGRRSGTGHSEIHMSLDENNIKQFTFSSRYMKNQQGRMTSTIQTREGQLPKLMNSKNEIQQRTLSMSGTNSVFDKKQGNF